MSIPIGMLCTAWEVHLVCQWESLGSQALITAKINHELQATRFNKFLPPPSKCLIINWLLQQYFQNDEILYSIPIFRWSLWNNMWAILMLRNVLRTVSQKYVTICTCLTVTLMKILDESFRLWQWSGRFRHLLFYISKRFELQAQINVKEWVINYTHILGYGLLIHGQK